MARKPRNGKAKTPAAGGQHRGVEEGVAVAPQANGGARPWPVEHVERWPIDKLVPYVNNPREHSAEQIDYIAGSMREFGQTQLIVVDEQGEIIAGHGRLLAAQKLEWVDIAVGIAVGWSEDQKKAYRIADNKIALGATWNDILLKGELTSLGKFDFSLMGFDQKEWTKLFNSVPLSATSQLANLKYAVIVRCDDELHQKSVMEQLSEMGLRIEALIS